MIFVGTQPPTPPAIAVPAVLESELRATGTIWLLFALFATAPLLTATLEKGWLELIFSKGIARWRIFAGRFCAALTLYALAFGLATFPLAARLWWRTGISTWQVAITLLIQTFSFAALLSVAALAALPQKGVALPIIAPAGLLALSPILAERRQTFYQIFSSPGAREIVDWTYRILPKCSELEDSCVSFLQSGRIASWWPYWSTALCVLAVLSLTVWQLARKSF